MICKVYYLLYPQGLCQVKPMKQCKHHASTYRVSINDSTQKPQAAGNRRVATYSPASGTLVPGLRGDIWTVYHVCVRRPLSDTRYRSTVGQQWITKVSFRAMTKSEKQRMIDGELYNAWCSELVLERNYARGLVQKYNATTGETTAYQANPGL